jgi:carbamoyltransferase
LCGDEVNSIVSVYSYLYSKKQHIIKLDNIYLGQKININKNFKIKEKSTEINEIINLLKDGEVVGLIQGRAEAGPRALGNRSLLLDPTIPNCKDIMNEIKKREKFRPFAISIIEEVVNDYFDFKNIDKSPFMMYAPQAKDKAKNVIPGILHVDNTCRVQTVTKKDNFVLYKLLQNFKVPMLMNTSFNLAGYPMVDSFEDVVFSLKNSKLKYIYFADEGKLLLK